MIRVGTALKLLRGGGGGGAREAEKGEEDPPLFAFSRSFSRWCENSSTSLLPIVCLASLRPSIRHQYGAEHTPGLVNKVNIRDVHFVTDYFA